MKVERFRDWDGTCAVGKWKLTTKDVSFELMDLFDLKSWALNCA